MWGRGFNLRGTFLVLAQAARHVGPGGRIIAFASVVSFLAGPDGAWVNAQVLRANGGFA